MAKPLSQPRWANVGGAITQPPEATKDIGWVAGGKPPAQYFNWLLNLIWQWCAYLDGLTGEALTWSAAHVFSAAVSLTGTFAFTGSTITVTPTGAVSFSPSVTTTLGAITPEDVPYVTQSSTVTARRALGKFRVGASTWSTIRFYVGVFSSNPFFEVTANALWTNATTKWTADNAGGADMYVLRIGLGGIYIHHGTDPGSGLSDATLATKGDSLLLDASENGGATRWRFATPTFHGVGDAGEPTFGTGFSTSNWNSTTNRKVGFYKDAAGVVHLCGVAAKTTATTGDTIFTLPAAFRPPSETANLVVGTGGTGMQVQITTAGVVKAVFGGGPVTIKLDLSGLTFHTNEP